MGDGRRDRFGTWKPDPRYAQRLEAESFQKSVEALKGYQKPQGERESDIAWRSDDWMA